MKKAENWKKKHREIKRVLIISYYYPPLVDVGSLRALGYSKHLRSFGWKPYVLTVKNPDCFYCVLGDEKSPAGVKVFYTISLLNMSRLLGRLNGFLASLLRAFGKTLSDNIFTNLLAIPDIFIGWIPLSVIHGVRIIRKHRIDLIYISCKPFSSALIGVCLKRVLGRPLIVDLQDPTIALPFVPNQKSMSFRFYKVITRAIEKFVLKEADRVMFITGQTEKAYHSLYPFLCGKTICIYNGFFPELLPKVNEKPFKKFTIIYVGNYYPYFENAEILFAALRKLIQRKNLTENEIRFVYLGENTDWFKEMRAKYGLEGIIECPGKVSRQESIKAVCRSHILYLRIVEDMISTKLYEGLATGTPFLAPISNKEVIRMIQEYSPQSVITDPEDPFALCEAIERLYQKYRLGYLKKYIPKDYWNSFNKKALTRKFTDELNSVLGSKIVKK